jgi:hypothetical protein
VACSRVYFTFTHKQLPNTTWSLLHVSFHIKQSAGCIKLWAYVMNNVKPIFLIYCQSWYFNSKSNNVRPNLSQWLRRLKRRSTATRLLRLWVRIPPVIWMSVCFDCCVFSDTGLCEEPITRPEESYRLWCVVVCDLETSWMRRPWPSVGCRAKRKKNCNNDYSERKDGMIRKVKPACNGTACADNFFVANRLFFIEVPEVMILDSEQFFLQTGLFYT